MKLATPKRLAVLGVAGFAAFGALALSNIGDSLVYYRTPSEVATSAKTGERVRLGGLVAAGSVRKEGETVRFTLTDGAADVVVVHRGDPPGVFQEGQGALVEGSFGADGAFHSDFLVVKHSNEYQGPDGGTYEAPGAAAAEESQ